MIDVEARFQEAVQSFWGARDAQKKKQEESGRIDAGTRGAVTGGSQMGALEVLVVDLLEEAGLKRIDVRTRTGVICCKVMPHHYDTKFCHIGSVGVCSWRIGKSI